MFIPAPFPSYLIPAITRRSNAPAATEPPHRPYVKPRTPDGDDVSHYDLNGWHTAQAGCCGGA